MAMIFSVNSLAEEQCPAPPETGVEYVAQTAKQFCQTTSQLARAGESRGWFIDELLNTWSDLVTTGRYTVACSEGAHIGMDRTGESMVEMFKGLREQSKKVGFVKVSPETYDTRDSKNMWKRGKAKPQGDMDWRKWPPVKLYEAFKKFSVYVEEIIAKEYSEYNCLAPEEQIKLMCRLISEGFFTTVVPSLVLNEVVWTTRLAEVTRSILAEEKAMRRVLATKGSQIVKSSTAHLPVAKPALKPAAKPAKPGKYAGSSELPPEQFLQQGYAAMRDAAPVTIADVTKSVNVESLKKFEQIAIDIEITRYDTARKEISKLEGELKSLNSKPVKSSATTARIEWIQKALTSDSMALGNGPHVVELLSQLSKYKDSFREIFEQMGMKLDDKGFDVAYQYMRTLVAVHDLGKTKPAATALALAAKTGKPMLKLTTHELSSAEAIAKIAKMNGLDAETTNLLIRDTLGHNGPGLPGTFWGEVAHKGFGPDPRPTNIYGMLLRILDRAGGPTMGPTGGVQKFTNQNLGFGQPWGKKMLEGTMGGNADKTLLQLEAIVSAIEQTYPVKISNNPLVRDSIATTKATQHAYAAIQWNVDEVSGTLAGKPFSDPQSFFNILNEKEAQISLGKLKPDYWETLPKALK